MLHEANAADKHRLLIPAIGSHAHTVLEFSGLGAVLGAEFPPQRIALKGSGEFNLIEDGSEIYVEPLDTQTTVRIRAEVVLEIAFGDCDAVKGKPMISTLDQMAGVVEGVAGSFLEADLLR